jgi:hypothetical protein
LTVAASAEPYPARLTVDYPDHLDRLSTLLRLLWIIPIVILFGILTSSGSDTIVTETGERVRSTGGGITGGLFAATVLMIVFRMRYPQWWFDFGRELRRFGARIGAYLTLLTDRYPSTVEEQAVHLELEYPDVEHDLNRWLPLVKWFLAIPHYIVLLVLWLAAVVAVVVAWFAILFTGHYPRSLFEFVVGVGRWTVRVDAYAFLLITDRYPPFSLK